eukprot:1111727-Prymnesium_polylepis.1
MARLANVWQTSGSRLAGAQHGSRSDRSPDTSGSPVHLASAKKHHLPSEGLPHRTKAAIMTMNRQTDAQRTATVHRQCESDFVTAAFLYTRLHS